MVARIRQLRTIWLDEDNEEDEDEVGPGRTIDASWVVSILNGESLVKGHPSPASCRRIHELLSDLHQLVVLRKTLKPLIPQLELSRFLASQDFSVLEVHERCTDLFESINEKLKRYRWSPRIYANGPGPIEQYQSVYEEGDSESIVVSMFLHELSERNTRPVSTMQSLWSLVLRGYEPPTLLQRKLPHSGALPGSRVQKEACALHARNNTELLKELWSWQEQSRSQHKKEGTVKSMTGYLKSVDRSTGTSLPSTVRRYGNPPGRRTKW